MNKSPELGSLQPSLPTTNIKQPIDEETRLAKLSDKQILQEVRKRLKNRKSNDLVGIATDLALIITQFRVPVGGNDPYQLNRGKNKFFDLHKIKVK
jgi:hypothetical protein